MEQQYAQTRRARILDAHERHLAAAGGVGAANMAHVITDTARELGLSEADVREAMLDAYTGPLGAG